MLFTTATFALLYLPLVLAGYFLIGRRSADGAAAWLFAASLFFYGYWMPAFTLLLLASIAVNFVCGLLIQRCPPGRPGRRRAWLVAGIAFNLLLLGWFKYANFFVDNFNAVFGLSVDIGRVVLPIGISFYSFTQIAFLADTYQGKVGEARVVHYGLFVTYFPHLVAGPVLHHAQMMPQFADPSVYRPRMAHLVAGLAIFAIGLFKKVVAADGIAPYADAVFKPVDGGAWAGTEEAWLGALAYTLQLYFDFSGYSDMAIGLSWMFNIRLPFNFDSPYKALNISDFWRRWHISLSTFLRDYLYVPLGGNRKGKVRRYVNLGLTMLLGGLWHGASWSFVLWGALHGLYLMVNHGFRAMMPAAVLQALDASRAWRLAAWTMTMLAVVVAWVFFRAETLPGAWRMVQGMVALAPAAEAGVLFGNAGLAMPVGWLWCAVLGAAAVVLPNSNAIGNWLIERLRAGVPWARVLGGAALAACLLLVLLNTARDAVSAFIYFNF
jgi:alginate O-acetyltransferase complex protein AlgI